MRAAQSHLAYPRCRVCRDQSKLLHYTAIHMQPWQPTPRRYSYQRNPAGHVWFDLERAADAAHYQLFTAARPSAQYGSYKRGMLLKSNLHRQRLKTFTLADLLTLEFRQQPHEQVEGVCCPEALAYIPAEDLPWVLDTLFDVHVVRCKYRFLRQPLRPH
jgi:hypothetical protein